MGLSIPCYYPKQAQSGRVVCPLMSDSVPTTRLAGLAGRPLRSRAVIDRLPVERDGLGWREMRCGLVWVCEDCLVQGSRK